jgi:hypothetical protein
MEKIRNCKLVGVGFVPDADVRLKVDYFHAGSTIRGILTTAMLRRGLFTNRYPRYSPGQYILTS